MLSTSSDCVCNTAVLTHFLTRLLLCPASFWPPSHTDWAHLLFWPLCSYYDSHRVTLQTLNFLWAQPFQSTEDTTGTCSLSVILGLLVYFISVWPSIYGINVQITLQLFFTLVPLQGKVSYNHTLIIIYFLWAMFAWWHFVGRCLFKTWGFAEIADNACWNHDLDKVLRKRKSKH